MELNLSSAPPPPRPANNRGNKRKRQNKQKAGKGNAAKKNRFAHTKKDPAAQQQNALQIAKQLASRASTSALDEFSIATPNSQYKSQVAKQASSSSTNAASTSSTTQAPFQFKRNRNKTGEVEYFKRDVIEPTVADPNAISNITAAASEAKKVDDESKTTATTTTTTTEENATTEQEPEQIFSDSPFATLGLSGPMCASIATHMQLEKPTVVQQTAIGDILAGTDVVLKGKTGLGKTLAFLLPLVDKLQQMEPRVKRGDGTYAVILAPTKELAEQLYDETSRVVGGAFRWLVPGVLSGGRKKKAEKASLRKGVTLLIATPGRLLDHLRTTQAFRVAALRWIVMDEADRLLDAGFEHDLYDIIGLLRQRSKNDIQTIMTSATLADSVRSIAIRVARLSSPKFVDADAAERKAARKAARLAKQETNDDEQDDDDNDDGLNTPLSMPSQLQQHFLTVPVKQRLVALIAFLRLIIASQENCAIVFCSNICTVEFLHMLCEKLMAPMADGSSGKLVDGDVVKLHGDLPLKVRQAAVARLRRNDDVGTTSEKQRAALLFCTDVAARGLDLPSVGWIVQFDPPTEASEYVHRAGRTARLGRKGDAVLFVTPEETAYVDLLRSRGLSLREMPLDPVLSTLNFKPQHGATKHAGDYVLQQLLYRTVEASASLTESARNGFAAHIRAYTTHQRGTKHIFNVHRLHLGHVAASFALRDTPADLAKTNMVDVRRNRQLANKEAQYKQGRLTKEQRREQAFSEFQAF